MKNKVLMLILLLNVTIMTSQDWTRYKYQELAFIADFPKEPTKTIEKVPTAVGELDMHMIMCEADSSDENVVYNVIKSDYPKENFENPTEEYINNVLDGAVNGAVSNVKGKLVFDNKIMFNGYSGRYFKIDVDYAFLHIKGVLVNNTMYIIQVICLEKNDNNNSIKRFFDSFDLINIKS